MKFIKDRRLVLIFFLFLLLVIIILLKSSSGKKETNIPTIPPSPTSSPTPYPTVKPTPEAIGTPNFYEKIRPEILKNYPLFDYLPYKTENYTVGYTSTLTLKITLIKDTPEIRQEVLDWISSKGVDPNTHKIIWKNQ